jgi:sodium-dependent dicarboxylate transporter 2/3/5
MARQTSAGGGLPVKPEEIRLARAAGKPFDWRRAGALALGLAGLGLALQSSPWPGTVDPAGNAVLLTREGQAAIGLCVLAITWWVTEAVPIGVTSVAIGVAQALCLIRPARAAFGDFMDPSVWFIFGSLVVGMAFTKTGLTKRMAYGTLILVGERTSLIMLGCCVMTAAMTLVMAHTAVAASVYPLLMAVHTVYQDDDRPTRFGKGLFIGMAFVAGAASTVTLLGAARGPVAIGFFREIAGRNISFVEFSFYMLPLGLGIVLLLWLYGAVVFRPERPSIPGLRDRARRLYDRLGPMTRREILTILIVASVVGLLSLPAIVPSLARLDQSAILLVSTILFFVTGVLGIRDLEEIPWNVILLFGGAMSLGLCLWQTGAATWLGVQGLAAVRHAPAVSFVLGVGVVVLLLTNVVINVAVIAVALPVALVMATHLGVAPEIVLFTTLAAAGMPFLLLTGAAPNAIAYESRQFTAREFFAAGLPASLLVLAALGVFVTWIWPLIGMPVVAP